MTIPDSYRLLLEAKGFGLAHPGLREVALGKRA
jgi:hypothetical protein